jgi:hypothetical protein
MDPDLGVSLSQSADVDFASEFGSLEMAARDQRAPQIAVIGELTDALTDSRDA